MKQFYNIDELNIEFAKRTSKKIVFTNGVFDIIHPGHIELFQFAKSCGDIVIVGINTDDSIRRLKGDSRPVFPLAERMEILEAIEFIDFVIPFSEDTPLTLIKKLYKIDILIKGGDYKTNEVVGREEVEKSGGKLLIFQFQSNYSTSAIINKVK